MARSRSYKPVYENTEKDYMSVVKKGLRKNPFYYEIENPQPYDQFNSNGGEIKIGETDHITIFYKHFNPSLIHRIVCLTSDGYCMQEVSELYKSIQLPHLHFIRFKNYNE